MEKIVYIPKIAIRRSADYYDIRGNAAVRIKRKLPLVPFILAAICAVFGVFLLVMNAIRTSEALAEKWTMGVEQGWERVLGALTSFLPISVFELFICLAIIVGLYLFVRLVLNLCGARFRGILTGLLAIGTVVLYILNLYMLSMGFGYYRSEMPLNQAGKGYNAVQAKTVAQYFLDDFNALSASFERDGNGCVICPYSFQELAEVMKDEYARLDSEYGGYLFEYTPTAKEFVNSWFLSDMLITGITFLPFGEATLNVCAPPSSIPLTLAHELAHTKGIQREGDANLIAEYLLLSSDNDYLRYCGYYDTFGNIAAAVSLAGDEAGFSQIAKGLDPAIREEQYYENDYWKSQPDIIGQIAEMFNNIYLTFNGADNGTESYSDGSQSEVIVPIDPETGEPEQDPDTGKPIRIPVYSQLQMIYFYLYECKFGPPARE